MNNYQLFLYDTFPRLLEQLEADQEAKWGLMTAHQMVEHLAFVLSIGNGRFNMTPNAEPDRLAYRRTRFLEAETPFAQSIRVAFIPEDPQPTMFPNLQLSKEFTLNQLQRFFDYYTEHPELTPAHPVFGPMSQGEWEQFQARHIKHHLQQFGLIEEDFKISDN